MSKKRIRVRKRLQNGSIGNFFIYGILALLLILGFIAVGGLPSTSFSHTGTQVTVITPTTGASQKTLQMKTFGYITVTPTPVPTTPATSPGIQAHIRTPKLN